MTTDRITIGLRELEDLVYGAVERQTLDSYLAEGIADNVLATLTDPDEREAYEVTVEDRA